MVLRIIKDMAYYKYYAGLTSQVGFCATPLRLDPYNRCQFSCEYCFASTRQGFGRKSEMKIGNPSSLFNRLKRVFDGKISSALDELISWRVPFQLGGMSDPFTKLESKEKVTLEYLKILKEFDYPVIISTKSSAIVSKDYLDVVSGSNIYVRFSTTVVDNKIKNRIDKGCAPVENIARAAKILHSEGVPVCFRFQPIIPEHEESYEYLLELAYASSVKHISAEYLKCPIDANKKFGKTLVSLLGGDPIKYYKRFGSIKQGREYILPIEYRAQNLMIIAAKARGNGMSFGFADNDLLLHSDGNACCSASDLYLRDAGFFTANIVSLAKKKKIGEKIYFDDYLCDWVPTSAVSTYLNSKSRIINCDAGQPEWLRYLQEMWKGNLGVFTPNYFDGIAITEERDAHGLPVFIKINSRFYDMLNAESPYNKKTHSHYATA